MRVAVFPADQRGCGWYRLLHPARVLRGHGHDLTIDPDLGYYHDPTGTEPPRLFLDADTVVIQRPVTATVAAFAQTVVDHGHRLVVDIDDALDALHARHPYRRDLAERDGWGLEHLHHCCAIADAVTVTTHPLADRYGQGKAHVLPNLVPEAYLTVRHRRSRRHTEPPLVGWTGRPESHIDDAAATGRSLAPVLARHGARFAAWGPTAATTWAQMGVDRRHGRQMPYRDLHDGYPRSVARLDVGLVPLADTGFNRAKSWLKGIEYAALGVPFVASPLPEYAKLAKMGAGLLAAAPAQWAGLVDELLGDPARRRELAEAGRAVAAGLTYEAHAGRWWEVWAGTTPRVDSRASVVQAVGDVPSPAPA